MKAPSKQIIATFSKNHHENRPDESKTALIPKTLPRNPKHTHFRSISCIVLYRFRAIATLIKSKEDRRY